jgi:hypothetical protein
MPDRRRFLFSSTAVAADAAPLSIVPQAVAQDADETPLPS